MTGAHKTGAPTCQVSEVGIPDCASGPAGRLRFVAAELAGIARRLAGRIRRG